MVQSKQPSPGTLYIAATPIGNLEDITLRCLRILSEVDLIAAEDTRHTRKLLTHFDIQTPLISYYREKEAQRSQELVQRLLTGESIALVSDAGTPGISDPGAVLVTTARKAGIVIVPLPGASALTTALSASGLSHPSFLFLGFPPSKNSKDGRCSPPFAIQHGPLSSTNLPAASGHCSPISSRLWAIVRHFGAES